MRRSWKSWAPPMATALGLLTALVGVLPAQAAGPKHFDVVNSTVTTYIGTASDTTIEIDNKAATQTIGSLQLTFPSSATQSGVTVPLRWTGIACVAVNAGDCDNWASSSSPDGTVVTFQTPSNSSSAVLPGQSIVIAASVVIPEGTVDIDTDFPAAVGAVVKQSNTFNDGGTANTFSGPNPTVTLSVAPSCVSSKCTVTPGGKLQQFSAEGGSPLAAALLRADDYDGVLPNPSCLALGLGEVVRVTGAASAPKTVTLTYSADAVALTSVKKASDWPVCMSAPYDFATLLPDGGVQPPTGEPRPNDLDFYQGQLVACSQLSAPSSSPCIKSRYQKNKKSALIVVVQLPKNPNDPKFF